MSAFLVLLLSHTLHAANVRANSPYGVQDGAAVPIVFTPGSGENVASLQFRLEYNTRQFSISQVQMGGGLRDAGKDIIFAEHNGYATLIIAGLNQTNIPDGLLATVYLEPLGSNPFPFDLELTSPVFSDPQGNAIAFNELPTEEEPDNSPDPAPTPGDDKGSDGEADPDEEPEASPPPTDSPDPVAQPNRPYYGAPLSGNGQRAVGETDATDSTTPPIPTANNGPSIPTQGGSPGQAVVPGAASSSPVASGYSGPMPPQTPAVRNTRPPAPRQLPFQPIADAPGVPGANLAADTSSSSGKLASAPRFPGLPNSSVEASEKGKLEELRSVTQQAVNRATESPLLPVLVFLVLLAGGALGWRRLKARR